jgi:hypothetical protein
MDAKKANTETPALASQLCGILFPYRWIYSISLICGLLSRRHSLYADRADLAERIKKKQANTEVTIFPG